jgi:hypothetical protein
MNARAFAPFLSTAAPSLSTGFGVRARLNSGGLNRGEYFGSLALKATNALITSVYLIRAAIKFK